LLSENSVIEDRFETTPDASSATFMRYSGIFDG